MIRFCDKVIYNIIKDEMTRGQLLNFFLDEEDRIFDIIAVYSREEILEGIITYDSLLKGTSLDDCINYTMLQPTEEFWEKASEYFKKNPDQLLTVIGSSGEVLGFAYDDNTDYYHTIASSIKSMESCGILALKLHKYRHIKMLVITDLNELAWMCCRLFQKEGYQVCVIGEKWEWFGYKSGQGYLECADFQKLYIYAEGSSFLRKERKFFHTRFECVAEFFKEIEYLALEGIKHVYVRKINAFMEKGISVCECRMPSSEELEYKTELEWKSIEQKANLNQYINYKSGFSDKRRRCLEEIYGADTIKILEKKSSFSLIDNNGIYVGNLIGKVINKDSSKKRIYLIGPCIVDGYGCVPEETLLSELQKLAGQNYQVVGLVLDGYDYQKWEKQMDDIPICNGDILVFIDVESCFLQRTCSQIDVSCMYNNSMRKTLFSEIPIHTNAEGNRILAKTMYEEYLKDEILRWKDCDREILQMGQILPEYAIQQINAYIENIRVQREGIVGSIVMNCNPFTYGHRYLIEYAAKQVDILYIFVVEEDRSIFKFEDRLEMVKAGTKDIENAFVVPSGRWVLSYETFPVYFEKATKQEILADASKDLEVFARYIAPALGIAKRFVGEEPTDNVTRQYNAQMQEILKRFGIKMEIIPRKQIDGQVISASAVRRYMKEENWEQVKQLVPETTYQRCIKQK